MKKKNFQKYKEQDNYKFKLLETIGGEIKEVWSESGMSAEDFICMCWLNFSFYGVLFDSSCMDISALID